jgi:hypothetical protein
MHRVHWNDISVCDPKIRRGDRMGRELTNIPLHKVPVYDLWASDCVIRDVTPVSAHNTHHPSQVPEPLLQIALSSRTHLITH